MIRVDLTEEERDILYNMLSNYVSDLRMEIADTDRKDYRDIIRQQKDILKKVMNALER